MKKAAMICMTVVVFNLFNMILFGQSASDEEKRIDQLIDSGKFVEAETLLERALEKYPDHEGLKQSQALLMIMEQLTGASGIEKSSNLVKTTNEIDGLILRGELEEAQQHLDRALAMYPEDEGLMASQMMVSIFKAVRYAWRQLRILVVVTLSLLVLAAVSIVAFIVLSVRRRPFVAAAVYTIVVYVCCLPIACVLLIIGGALSVVWKDLSQYPVIQHTFYGLTSGFLGAVGGAINCSVTLTRRSEDPVPEVGAFSYFFFKPLNGFYLSVAMYFALLTGNIALFKGAGAELPSVWSVGLLALLTGIFSENAIEKLRQISDTAFGATRDTVRQLAGTVREGVSAEPAADVVADQDGVTASR